MKARKLIPTIFLITAMIFLAGCNMDTSKLFASSNGDGNHGLNACPMIGYVSGFSIKYTASMALPANLAVAIDDQAISYDSCDTNNSTIFPVSIQGSGSNLTISVPIDGSSPLYSLYFSSNSGQPTRNDVSFKIYGRSSCSDVLTLIDDRQNLAIPWQPVETYGPSCGAYGYTATVLAP